MVNKRLENGYSIPSRERETYTSKDGFEFDIYTSRWQLSVNSSLNIDWLADLLPDAQEEALDEPLPIEPLNWQHPPFVYQF